MSVEVEILFDGKLMRVILDGDRSFALNREEAFDLFEKISEKIVEMAVQQKD